MVRTREGRNNEMDFKERRNDDDVGSTCIGYGRNDNDRRLGNKISVIPEEYSGNNNGRQNTNTTCAIGDDFHRYNFRIAVRDENVGNCEETNRNISAIYEENIRTNENISTIDQENSKHFETTDGNIRAMSQEFNINDSKLPPILFLPCPCPIVSPPTSIPSTTISPTTNLLQPRPQEYNFCKNEPVTRPLCEIDAITHPTCNPDQWYESEMLDDSHESRDVEMAFSVSEVIDKTMVMEVTTEMPEMEALPDMRTLGIIAPSISPKPKMSI
ncbi:hypothetical protein WDU94_002269 [Cyamophila willieti]